jgi:hypothetical protein
VAQHRHAKKVRVSEIRASDLARSGWHPISVSNARLALQTIADDGVQRRVAGLIGEEKGRELTPARVAVPCSDRNGACVSDTPEPVVTPDRLSVPKLDPEIERQCELQRQEFARRHIQRKHAFTLIWPSVCRRLESRPNINATELFDELRAQYPGAFTAANSTPLSVVSASGVKMPARGA